MSLSQLKYAGGDRDDITKYQFKILQYREIKCEEGPKTTSQEPTFEHQKCKHCTIAKELKRMDTRNVVPQQNWVKASGGKSNLYNVQYEEV